MSGTKQINWDERFNEGSFDEVDSVQRMRRELGDDPDTHIDLHISAWGLDQFLKSMEFALRYQKGEIKP